MTPPNPTARKEGEDRFVKDQFADIWDDFSDSDYHLDYDVDEFLAKAEGSGLIECVPVTCEALDDPFAAERGIQPNGMMWQLTAAGLARYRVARSSPARLQEEDK